MKDRIFSTPTTANIELTEICNVKCTHCYNFWRDESIGQVSVSREKLLHTFEALEEAGIFHVVLTGGEPFAKFDTLLYALDLAKDRGMSVSVNSNLMLATDDRILKLADKGVDHILTSLPSVNQADTDNIMNKTHSFEKIMRGIKTTIAHGIRVSVNMVITRETMGQVYEAGKLISDLGAQTLFVTRAVPPTYSQENDNSNYLLSASETKNVLDEAIRARDDFGIMIGSLVSYPLCFLEDLEKYSDFVGRGCPAQSGHRMSINATGDIHACVHEEESYGNIHEDSVTDIFDEDMKKWRDGSLHYSGCGDCPYNKICDSGCRMTALGVYGDHRAKDPLYVGPQVFEKLYEFNPDSKFLDDAIKGLPLFAATGLRFREEKGFFLINIRWGNTVTLNSEVGEVIRKSHETSEPFLITDFDEHHHPLIANLFQKGAIVAEAYKNDGSQSKLGLSLNVEALPQTLS